MTFQHGCLHHWISPGRMYFLNTSISIDNCVTAVTTYQRDFTDDPNNEIKTLLISIGDLVNMAMTTERLLSLFFSLLLIRVSK